MKNHDDNLHGNGVFPLFHVSLLSMLEGCSESRFNFAYPRILPEFKKWIKCTKKRNNMRFMN